jgi:hypothetical protein
VIAYFFRVPVFSLVVTTFHFVSLAGIPMLIHIFGVDDGVINEVLGFLYATMMSTYRLVFTGYTLLHYISCILWSKLTLISEIMLLLDIVNGWRSDNVKENRLLAMFF